MFYLFAFSYSLRAVSIAVFASVSLMRGAACSATVFNSYVLDKMTSGIYNKVLYLATGALMSSQSCYQGETIPCISHAVVIER